jgi:hypothetical protein
MVKLMTPILGWYDHLKDLRGLSGDGYRSSLHADKTIRDAAEQKFLVLGRRRRSGVFMTIIGVE